MCMCIYMHLIRISLSNKRLRGWNIKIMMPHFQVCLNNNDFVLREINYAIMIKKSQLDLFSVIIIVWCDKAVIYKLFEWGGIFLTILDSIKIFWGLGTSHDTNLCLKMVTLPTSTTDGCLVLGCYTSYSSFYFSQKWSDLLNF